MSKLEKLRDYYQLHKRFINVTKSKHVDEVKYWQGYEDAMKAFEEQVEFLLRSQE